MKRPLLIFCLIFLLSVRLILYFTGPPGNPYEEYSGSISAIGTVEKKERKNDEQVFYLRSVAIIHGDTQSKIKHIGLICAGATAPPIGARISVSGSLWLYPEATNPGEFDMRSYYLCLGYGGRLRVSEWSLAADGYSLWREGLWQLRLKLGELYDMLLPAEDSSVLKAMVLGDKGDLSAELKDLYRANGISHILAISGLHISILGMGLYRLLRKSSLPVLPSALISIFLMVNYAVFCGAGTSTVRAVIMFGLSAGADAERRSYDLPTALGLSAASTVISNPYLLLTSAFWLSYSAVAGVAIFGPALWGEVRLQNKRAQSVLSAISSGMSVSIFTLPFILMFYYELPLYSVILNLLVIPLMSLLMICGLIILPLGLIYLPLGIVAGIPCHAILSAYRLLCEFFSSLPLHSYVAGCPSALRLALAWLCFLLIILMQEQRLKRMFKKRGIKAGEHFARKLLLGRLLLSALAVFILLLQIRPRFRLTMLDVGQGDGICVESREAVLMIDGGSTSKDKLYQYQLGPFLKYSGISHIDCWFLSHPDKDHISGLVDLLSDEDCTISVEAIVLPDAEGAEEDFVTITTLAAARGCKVYFLAAGDELSFGELGIDCLHPQSGYSCDDVNAYSEILKLSYKGLTAVFTGDATIESEAAVLKEISAGKLKEPGTVDILKLGHHGSHTSSSQEWLDMLKPRIALISCGRNNSYGHPHADVMERIEAAGCDIYRTDHAGAVVIRPRRGGYTVEGYLDG